MADRAFAFADPGIAALLAERFVPIAENCSYLQRQADAEGEFFRVLAEQGHYAGRKVPTDTRQGMYAATPDGLLLASVNTHDPRRLRRALDAALERWDHGDRGAEPAGAGWREDGRGFGLKVEPPLDGLILRVWSRDLPRDPATDQRPDDWRRQAHNLDHAWFRAADAASMVPDRPLSAGAAGRWPDALARRLARFHLIDNVRGETPMWKADEVQRCEVEVRVDSVDGQRARLSLSGAARLEGRCQWVNDFTRFAYDGLHGMDVELSGALEWDDGFRRFTRFDVVAAGTRWGGTQYNSRQGDFDAAPIGFVLELAAPGPGHLGTLAAGDLTPPQGIGRRYFQDGGGERA